MVIRNGGGIFLRKASWRLGELGIAIGGLVLGWLCYSIANNILTYLRTLPEERR